MLSCCLFVFLSFSIFVFLVFVVYLSFCLFYLLFFVVLLFCHFVCKVALSDQGCIIRAARTAKKTWRKKWKIVINQSRFPLHTLPLLCCPAPQSHSNCWRPTAAAGKRNLQVPYLKSMHSLALFDAAFFHEYFCWMNNQSIFLNE